MHEIRLALTYDDVLLVPRRSSIASRRDVDTTARLTRNLKLGVPIVSANMDTVTDARLAVALAPEGARVKRPEEVVVRDVHTTDPRRTIRDASLQMARSEVSSLLVVDRAGT